MGLNFEYSKDSSEFIAKEQSYVCVGGGQTLVDGKLLRNIKHRGILAKPA